MTKFIALDVETANADFSSICKIGIVEFEGGTILSRWDTYINPKGYFDPFNTSIHGIYASDVADSPSFEEAYPQLSSMLSEAVVVHHGHFDRTAFFRCYDRFGLEEIECQWLNTITVVRRAFPEFAQKGYGLANLAKHFQIELNHHDALSDAEATGRIFSICLATSGTTVQEWIAKARRPIPSAATVSIKGEGNPEGSFFGCCIVFTGALKILRRDAAALARKVGFEVQSNVSKKITHLCVGLQDQDRLVGYEKSSKHRKAEELISNGFSIEIMSEADFLMLAEIEASK